MNANEYKCAMCDAVIEKGRSDEEALAEAREVYTSSELATGMEVVCDDCFDLINSYLPRMREEMKADHLKN